MPGEMRTQSEAVIVSRVCRPSSKGIFSLRSRSPRSSSAPEVWQSETKTEYPFCLKARALSSPV